MSKQSIVILLMMALYALPASGLGSYSPQNPELNESLEHELDQDIIIGTDCGMGVRSVVLPGSMMKEDSFLGACSLLTKRVIIPEGEIYGGVPAKKINTSS